MDPRIQIRIRIHTKMSWIRNTGHVSCLLSCPLVLSSGCILSCLLPHRPLSTLYLSFFLHCLPRYPLLCPIPSAVLLCPLPCPASLFVSFTYGTYNLIILVGVCCGSASVRIRSQHFRSVRIRNTGFQILALHAVQIHATWDV